MLWLNAALAFSITMLILSMVTSVFVETFHRLSAIRVKGLRLMLGHFFDRVVAQYTPQADTQTLALLKEEFLDTMTVNRAPTGTAFKGKISRSNDDASHDEGLWNYLWQGRRLDHLDINDFMSRLGSSKFGDNIRANSSGITETILKDIAQKFAAFGDEASEFFQRRARLFSVVTAMFVAWAMFVQPQLLLTTYLQNPDIANKVLEMQENVTKDYVASKQKELITAQAANDQANLEKASKALQDAMTAGNAKMASLQQAGVPIGWNDERLAAAGFRKSSLLGIIPISVPAEWTDRSRATILWLIIGGLLVGLGGPFWYGLVNSFTNIKNALGGGKNQPTKLAASSDIVTTTAQPQTPVEHFFVAAAGRDATSGGSLVQVAEEDAVG